MLIEYLCILNFRNKNTFLIFKYMNFYNYSGPDCNVEL